jgi:uncharacterized protein (TIGR02246 family)
MCRIKDKSSMSRGWLIADAIPLILLGLVMTGQTSAQNVTAAKTGPTSGPGIEEVAESLGQMAERFVKAFNERDAAAIAAMFTPDGEIVGLDGARVAGREQIEGYHRAIFSREVVPKIALEANDLRLASPGVAFEEGQIHLTLADDEPVRSIHYRATHVRQADGSWLTASSRNLADVTTPSERIRPLHWLIGEWTLEQEDGGRIDMAIDLDEQGNHLLGQAVITDAGEGRQVIQLRIGWNPATASVYWWTFDSDGGNASGPWARSGRNWIIHSTGMTADDEASASAQTLVRDGDSMVWLATHRILAGEAQPDLTYRFVRRAPDPLSLLESEAAAVSDEE